MAALGEVLEMTMVQSVVAGPRVRGSSLGGEGGKGCRFLGRICCLAVSFWWVGGTRSMESNVTYTWI